MKINEQASYRRFAIILAVLLILALITVIPCLTLDGKSYYLQLRSIIVGGDPSFFDENSFYQHQTIFYILPSGYVPHPFALGFAVILTPFFLLGHGLAFIMNLIGFGPPANGYTFPEVLLTLMASAGLGSFGLWLSGIIAARMHGIKPALWATLGLALATPLPAYLYLQPSFAHSLNLLASALVLLIWLQPGEDRVTRRALALGLAIGLAALLRWQDGVFLLLPACDVIRYWKKWKFQRSFMYLLIVGIGMFVVLMPQILLWKIQYGVWITFPQNFSKGGGFMQWANPQILPLLMGSRHGLISWTPVMAIALIGMLWLAIRKSAIGIPLLILLLIQFYINSVVADWWAGMCFGARRFLDMIPFFVLASALLFSELPRWCRKWIPVVIGALIIWNASLMYHYFAGHVGTEDPVAFSTWCQLNWGLINQHPAVAVGGMILIAAALWIVHRLFRSDDSPPLSAFPRWLPSTWVIIVAIAYFGLWTLNLARTTIHIEKILIPNPKPFYREWKTLAFQPPFQGCRLNDVVTPTTPWQQLAPWSMQPGGEWRLVTACEGNLSPGDTAAIFHVQGVDGTSWETALLWDVATGPRQISKTELKHWQPNAVVASLDIPEDIRRTPFRTFSPLPLYLWQWWKFTTDYQASHFPFHASYEHILTLPDNLTPKLFEIHLHGAKKCHIYGIGRME